MRNTAADPMAPEDTRTDRLRALPWLACLVGVAPLLFGGFPLGHDWQYELVRVSEYQAALVAGQLPPYWSENLYAGYGSPVFLYYAPLFSAAASLAGWLLGSVPRAAAFALVAAAALSVPFSYAFLHALLERAGLRDRAAARIGTVFFVLHPYLLGNKLVRNADAEFLALSLVPIALAGVALAGRAPPRGFALVSAGQPVGGAGPQTPGAIGGAFPTGPAPAPVGGGGRGALGGCPGGGGRWASCSGGPGRASRSGRSCHGCRCSSSRGG